MRSIIAALTCGLLSAAAIKSAPQDASTPQPTFRSGVELVHVDVSVLDNDRRPVRDLTAADFTVREDGKVREIAAFSAVTLPQRPIEAPSGWTRDVAPDVVSNLVPREGRLVIIVLDRSIPNENMAWARRTAQAAVDQLGPSDLAAVVYTSSGVPQNFTSDRRRLRAAIEQPFLGFPDDEHAGQRGECVCGLCSLETMTNIAEAVRNVPQRRKILLFIGSALPLEDHTMPAYTALVVPPGIVCNPGIRHARENLLRAAGVANLAIHTFDASLLASLAPTAALSAAPGDRREAVKSHLDRQNNLAVYSAETGGRAIKNTNALWEAVSDVFAETASYYVLGFTPASTKTDGRYHAIEVDVNRRDATVHARQGYYGPSPAANSRPTTAVEAPKSLVQTLAGLWPETEMPLSVSAAAFASPHERKGLVAIVLRAQAPVALDTGGSVRASTKINVLAGAYDRDGRTIDSQVQTISVTPPSGAERVFEYEVHSRLDLAPGRHEIRLAAEDLSRNLRGSVYTYVDVPDFSSLPLSLSGIVLSTSTTAPAGVFEHVLPLTPTAQRQFGSSRRVAAFVRVYDRGPASRVTMIARILDNRERTSFEQTTVLDTSQKGPIRAADYTLDLPLSKLPKGEYLLTIEATRENRTQRGDVRFSVR